MPASPLCQRAGRGLARCPPGGDRADPAARSLAGVGAAGPAGRAAHRRGHDRGRPATAHRASLVAVLLPATFYGEGLRRAFVSLTARAGPADRLARPDRCAAAVVPAPVLLLARAAGHSDLGPAVRRRRWVGASRDRAGVPHRLGGAVGDADLGLPGGVADAHRMAGQSLGRRGDRVVRGRLRAGIRAVPLAAAPARRAVRRVHPGRRDGRGRDSGSTCCTCWCWSASCSRCASMPVGGVPWRPPDDMADDERNWAGPWPQPRHLDSGRGGARLEAPSR